MQLLAKVLNDTIDLIVCHAASLIAIRRPVWDKVFNVRRMSPTQTGTWRLLLLAAAHFCGMATPNAIQPCKESPDRIHLRA